MMLTTIGGVALVVVLGAAWILRRRRRRSSVEPLTYPIEAERQRRALRSLAAADYAKFTERRRNGRSS